eukprot:3529125-Amphidinium_carterae.1
MAMFGASPIANTDSLDSSPPQRTGALSSGVTTAPAQPAAVGQVDRVVPSIGSGCPAWAGSIGPAWSCCPAWTCFTNGSGCLTIAGPISATRTTSVLAFQMATHALAEQGSVGLRMISETFVPNPCEEPRGLRRERQVSMDSGRGQIVFPRLDQRMLEDVNERTTHAYNS